VAFKVLQAEPRFVAPQLARRVVLPWLVVFKVRRAERQFVALPSVRMVKLLQDEARLALVVMAEVEWLPPALPELAQALLASRPQDDILPQPRYEATTTTGVFTVPDGVPSILELG
jgi:hypothetical protein